MAKRLNRIIAIGLAFSSSLGLLACQEELPTLVDEDLFPVEAITVEVRLPWDEFASNLEVWGGYGTPSQLEKWIVARRFEGLLDARMLMDFYSYPTTVSVRDSTGSVRPDSSLTFPGGRLVVRIDTTASVFPGPVTLALAAPEADWHFRSVTWSLAVDTVGDRRPWPEEGAGPATPLGSAEWDPAAGDSVVFQLDSAAVALWEDPLTADQGARLEALTEGVRLEILSVQFSVNARASINPDTVVSVPVAVLGETFVYEPALEVQENSILVGGVPAWRTVFRVSIPETLDGPPSLCAQVVCPVRLEEEGVSGAFLVLRTQAPPAAFRPTDPLLVDVRSVLEPSRLPKSPLGASQVGGLGLRLGPEAFGEEDGVEVEVPLGPLVRALIAKNADPDLRIPPDLALLSADEPLSLYYASFHGPESLLAPELLLVLTFGEEVVIR